MTEPRDPEVRQLLLETLRLVVRAESVLTQLVQHQVKIAAFLEHAETFADIESSRLARRKEDKDA